MRFRPSEPYSPGTLDARQHSLTLFEALQDSDVSGGIRIATVLRVHSDRMTCDLKTQNGASIHNVPVVTPFGLVEGEIYGSLDLPQVGQRVLVAFVEGREGLAFILPFTVLPYLHPEVTNGTPVSSGSKQFTKKLLEGNKSKTYKRIFPNGTTIEVQEDGTLIWEIPSGSFVRLKQSNGKIEITASGNEIDLNGSTKSLVTHAELNTALQTFLTALKAAVAAGCSAGSGGTIATVTLNISSSEATKVKTS